jgi:hypothetical protein
MSSIVEGDVLISHALQSEHSPRLDHTRWNLLCCDSSKIADVTMFNVNSDYQARGCSVAVGNVPNVVNS